MGLIKKIIRIANNSLRLILNELVFNGLLSPLGNRPTATCYFPRVIDASKVEHYGKKQKRTALTGITRMGGACYMTWL
jgi:hypothetical protein